MTYTFLLMAVYLSLLLVVFAVNALFLRFGLRWAKVEDVTFGRACKAVVFASVLCIATDLTQRFCFGEIASPVADSIVLALQCGIWLLVLWLFFGTNLLRSVQALLPSVVFSLLLFAFLTVVFVPFVAEAYVVPTGSMAPTILGRHIECSCETCSHPAFVGASQEADRRGQEPHCICVDFHTNSIKEVRGVPNQGDRIIAAKFLTPQRWEIAVFKLPSDPAVRYVKRVVGLPGETIHIENGSVFALSLIHI